MFSINIYFTFIHSQRTWEPWESHASEWMRLPEAHKSASPSPKGRPPTWDASDVVGRSQDPTLDRIQTMLFQVHQNDTAMNQTKIIYLFTNWYDKEWDQNKGFFFSSNPVMNGLITWVVGSNNGCSEAGMWARSLCAFTGARRPQLEQHCAQM